MNQVQCNFINPCVHPSDVGEFKVLQGTNWPDGCPDEGSKQVGGKSCVFHQRACDGLSDGASIGYSCETKHVINIIGRRFWITVLLRVHCMSSSTHGQSQWAKAHRACEMGGLKVINNYHNTTITLRQLLHQIVIVEKLPPYNELTLASCNKEWTSSIKSW